MSAPRPGPSPPATPTGAINPSAHPRAASSSWISPSPPADGGEGWGEEVRFYWFPLSSVLLYVFFHLPCSAESRTGRWGRHTPCRGCGAGAGALVVLWNRQHAFVGEPEPLTPCVRNSNR